MNKHLLTAAMLTLAASLGCGDQPAPAPDTQTQSQVGSLQLALTGTGASGARYILRNGTMTLESPLVTEFLDSEDNLESPTVTRAVPAGSYSLFLQEGWRLDRVDPDGTLTVGVPAELTTSNPQLFEVIANGTTSVSLGFRSGSDVIGMGKVEVGIEVSESTAPGAGSCRADSECSPGATCCVTGFLGTCVTLEPGASCALPDLTVSESAARASVLIGRETFQADSCALAEGCVDQAGSRRLLRFDTETPNIGEADMILGPPSTDLGFEFSSCHNHFHFEGYAAYQLLDLGGNVVRTGHKQAFCLLDSNEVVPGSGPRKYNCEFQGITAGWSDVYTSNLDCQWVDITDVAPGEYVLSITINHERTLPESNYDNNSVAVPVTIPEETIPDPLSACSRVQGGEQRDCGWSLAEGGVGLRCTPGEAITAACGCQGLGTCSNDPVMRACEGQGACTSAEALVSVDDSCDLCPAAAFVCPASGVYTLMVGSISSNSTSICLPETNPRGIQNDAGTPLPDAGTTQPVPDAGAPVLDAGTPESGDDAEAAPPL